MINSQDCYEAFGDPWTTHDEGKYMVMWNVPEYIWKYVPAIPRRIYLNKQMMLPLHVAFLNVIERGLGEEIKTWDGCFNVRAIRGYENNYDTLILEGKTYQAMRYMSIHGWGCAIDINRATNKLGSKPKMSKELVQCFKDADFDWGGDWTRPDGMHFQLSYLTSW